MRSLGRHGDEELYHQKLLGNHRQKYIYIFYNIYIYIYILQYIFYNFNQIKEYRRVQQWGNDNSGKHIHHPSQTCSPDQEHSTRLFRHCYSPTKFLYVGHKPTFMLTTTFYTALLSHSKKTGKIC